MNTKTMFKEFSETSSKEWTSIIEGNLKGASFEETLVWKSAEGIQVAPFYHKDLIGAETRTPLQTETWKIGQLISVIDAVSANKQAINFLNSGAENLSFYITSEEINISILLYEIDLDKTSIYFNLPFLSSNYIKDIINFVGTSINNVFFNISVLSNLAKTGNWYTSKETDFKILDEIVDLGVSNVLMVNAAPYQNAGANMVEQLAISIAHANEYLSFFDTRESLEKIKTVTIKVAIGTNYFFEIAKLRALRILWNVLQEGYNTTMQLHIITEPTKRNKTLYDYNVNMLRTTTEAMSAVLGGANTVFNMPYDAIFHNSNDFGDRIALNQLLLLKEESSLDKVNNPADGSYYIENITNQLAEKALELFKEIEKGGGFLESLQKGELQKLISNSSLKEQEKFNTNEEVLVGTNKYRNLMDKMKQNLDFEPFASDILKNTEVEPIVERRLAEKLEQEILKDE
ncbi:heterodimeric methylmalonyl-CoA mutase small subunit [Maribacter vaceletii]|uniref:Heterodimeric methylmalonyl-CoA mutase small subunit n=1 Tax=Maribacter vaceletii TaxID=1206816 RepID=A0A495EE71_9FLAO|nr:methylmalonyl-CoA mutase subunit beta [Maribacter vaceletii]RKR15188.1 heterodimeric methylmalonyl-CoA mutase small subunit [Maribacter vaceletii]